MKKSVSLSIMPLQVKFGDKKALEIASKIGVDAVDFELPGRDASDSPCHSSSRLRCFRR